MDPQERPKRRLVTYVTEEVYERLLLESKAANRSISSIAEMKISAGMNCSTEQTGPAHPSETEIKNSVLETITNLPDENLQILADKLSRILDRHEPAQNSTPQKSSKPDISKLDIKKVQDMATKVLNFMENKGLTQRSFKAKYGIDITQISRWKQGIKLMSPETFERFEKILASTS